MQQSKVSVKDSEENSIFGEVSYYMVGGAHVSSICRSSFYHLRNLSRIRKYFTKESAEVAVHDHAFVTSKLDYCNALLYGLPKYQLQRLQYLQNTAARVVFQLTLKYLQVKITNLLRVVE